MHGTTTTIVWPGGKLFWKHSWYPEDGRERTWVLVDITEPLNFSNPRALLLLGFIICKKKNFLLFKPLWVGFAATGSQRLSNWNTSWMRLWKSGPFQSIPTGAEAKFQNINLTTPLPHFNTFHSSPSPENYNPRALALSLSLPTPLSLLLLSHTSMMWRTLSPLRGGPFSSFSCLVPRTVCSTITSSKQISDQVPIPTPSLLSTIQYFPLLLH